jgi:hypothetical protein
MIRNNHEIENYSWGVLQDMIEREVNAAFKLRVDSVMPSKKEIKTIIRDTVKGERQKKVIKNTSPKGKDLKKEEKQVKSG